MTLQELLKAQGLSEEQINKIIGEMKGNKLFISGEENIDTRYAKLKEDFENLTAQHGEASKLIDQLKKDNKGNEDLQGKITDYESQIAQLQTELLDAKIDAAMDRMLNKAGAKADDFDYLKFQWKKKGEISLDDKGEIKGGDDAVAGLKIQCPSQFDAGKGGKLIEENRLPENENKNTVTHEDFSKMGYKDRLKLYKENPEAYKELTNKN